MVPVYRPSGIRHGGGVNLMQAFLRNVGTFAPRGSTRDEGRPFRAVLQGEALNRLKLLEAESPQVVSVEEKASKERQVRTQKMSD